MHIKEVLDGSIGTGRTIQQCLCSIDLESSFEDLLVLPHPPRPIDATVMKPEHGIVWGVVKTTTWITGPGE